MAYEDLKSAIRQQYNVARGAVKREGLEAEGRATSTAGRRAAISGVSGPLRIAAEREAREGAQAVTDRRLGQLDAAEAGGTIEVEKAKIADENARKLANEQFVQSLFGGIGGIFGALASLGANGTGANIAQHKLDIGTSAIPTYGSTT